MTGKSIETPVLVVGAGPIGSAVALDLAQRGCRTTLVDQMSETSRSAKAGTLSVRTMEFCRRWGIADRIANGKFPSDFPGDVVYCTALAGLLVGREEFPSAEQRTPPDSSPEMLRRYPQMWFDPLLLETARGTGLSDVRLEHRVESVRQDTSSVIAEVTDLASGETVFIEAEYLIACDGAGSAIRNQLDIPFEGNPALSYSLSALLRIPDFLGYHDKGYAERYLFLGTQGTRSNLTCVDGREYWRFTIVDSEERLDPAKLDLDAVIADGLGRDDIDYEVVQILPWRRSQCVARSYRSGRVLLAGDSAHTMSPTGGHGMNTGLGDVVDLTWKLEAVLRGWGGDGLLDSYQAERHPVAVRNSEWSTRNFKAWKRADDWDLINDRSAEGDAARARISAQLSAALEEEWNSIGVSMGYRYDPSPIVVPDGSAAPADKANEFIQTARPGHRAPHAWLSDGRSTIDLFGQGFTLLNFGAGQFEAGRLVDAAARQGVPLDIIEIANPHIAALYERKMVLVRPDGHSAWRGDRAPDNPDSVVSTVRGAGGA